MGSLDIIRWHDLRWPGHKIFRKYAVNMTGQVPMSKTVVPSTAVLSLSSKTVRGISRYPIGARVKISGLLGKSLFCTDVKFYRWHIGWCAYCILNCGLLWSARSSLTVCHEYALLSWMRISGCKYCRRLLVKPVFQQSWQDTLSFVLIREHLSYSNDTHGRQALHA